MLFDFSLGKLSRYKPAVFIALAERFDIPLEHINTQRPEGKRRVLEGVVERIEPGAPFSLDAMLSILDYAHDSAVGEDDLAGLYTFALALEDHKKAVLCTLEKPDIPSKTHYN